MKKNPINFVLWQARLYKKKKSVLLFFWCHAPVLLGKNLTLNACNNREFLVRLLWWSAKKYCGVWDVWLVFTWICVLPLSAVAFAPPPHNTIFGTWTVACYLLLGYTDKMKHKTCIKWKRECERERERKREKCTRGVHRLNITGTNGTTLYAPICTQKVE